MASKTTSRTDKGLSRLCSVARAALANERRTNVRSRLRVVVGLLERKRPVRKILSQAVVSRSTAYQYLRLFREGGTEALAKHTTPGRPVQEIPAVVRSRFEHLKKLGSAREPNRIVYVPERERAVLAAVGWPISCRRISQLFRQFALALDGVRVRRHRRIERAIRHLDGDTRMLYRGDGSQRFRGAALRARIRVEAYGYALELHQNDRQLLHRFIAAYHGVRLCDVSVS